MQTNGKEGEWCHEICGRRKGESSSYTYILAEWDISFDSKSQLDPPPPRVPRASERTRNKKGKKKKKSAPSGKPEERIKEKAIINIPGKNVVLRPSSPSFW